MIDFLMRAFPALFFFLAFKHFFTSARRASEDDYKGVAIRIPKALHYLLFPGSKLEKKPLFPVVLSVVCLTATVAILVVSVWITFFLNVQEFEKDMIYSSSFACIMCCLIIAFLISWIIIVVHQRTVPIILRVIVIVMTIICVLFLGNALIGFIFQIV